MPPVRSGPLAAWHPVWVAGQVSLDEVVDAVRGDDAPHLVTGLPGVDAPAVPLRDALVLWRHMGASVRVVLPVPGDVRGLTGPAPLRAAALEAGEAVIGGVLGLVPDVVTHAPSSAPPSVTWTAFAAEPGPADPLDPADAQYELTTAIRDCTSALATAGVSGGTADGEGVQAARRAGERVNLPPGFPPRAVALLSQAERLQAVLDLALADPAGGSVDQHGMAARADALRPLITAVRRARVAAYNAGTRSGD